jgi:hypothetical protein
MTHPDYGAAPDAGAFSQRNVKWRSQELQFKVNYP